MVPRVAGNFCAEANGKRSRVTSQVPPASALPPCGHITWYEGGRRKARKTTGMGLEGEKRERRKEKLKAARRQYEKPEKGKGEAAPPSHLLLTHTFWVTFIISLYSGSIWHLPLRSEPCCAKRESRSFCS